MKRFMNYALEMDSGVMMYIQSFIKIGSGIQKLLGRNEHADTDSKMTS
jgi:hypothetical protein